MLVEKKLSEALKDFDNGKAVLVLTTMVDGSVCCDRLEDLFPEDTHFLVNVPAYANPEFEAAAQNMVHRKKVEDDNPENKPEGEELPPPHNLKELGRNEEERP